MPPEKGDAACLWDMLDAARTVQEMTAGIDFTGGRVAHLVRGGGPEFEADRCNEIAIAGRRRRLHY